MSYAFPSHVVHLNLKNVGTKQQNVYVTQPLFESRMNWVYDPAPPAPLWIIVIPL